MNSSYSRPRTLAFLSALAVGIAVVVRAYVQPNESASKPAIEIPQWCLVPQNAEQIRMFPPDSKNPKLFVLTYRLSASEINAAQLGDAVISHLTRIGATFAGSAGQNTNDRIEKWADRDPTIQHMRSIWRHHAAKSTIEWQIITNADKGVHVVRFMEFRD